MATKDVAGKTPPLLKTRTKDPMESSWRMHMARLRARACHALLCIRVIDSLSFSLSFNSFLLAFVERRPVGPRRVRGRVHDVPQRVLVLEPEAPLPAVRRRRVLRVLQQPHQVYLQGIVLQL